MCLSISLRLTTEYGKSNHILKDVISKENLVKGQWHHVVLSYSESTQMTNTSSQDGSSVYVGKVYILFAYTL